MTSLLWFYTGKRRMNLSEKKQKYITRAFETAMTSDRKLERALAEDKPLEIDFTGWRPIRKPWDILTNIFNCGPLLGITEQDIQNSPAFAAYSNHLSEKGLTIKSLSAEDHIGRNSTVCFAKLTLEKL